MKRIFIALLCLLMGVQAAARAETVSVTVQEMAGAIEAQLFGHTFADMPPDELAALAGEQGAYDFIGRQNRDGTIRYLLGSLKPGAAKPNMKGSVETPAGLWNISRDGHYMLMQPGVVNDYVPTPVEALFHECACGAGGLEALRDASRRGVSFVEPPPPFAVVGMHSVLGWHRKYIPLDEAQIRQFKRDRKIKNPEGMNYVIGYTLGEKDEYGYYEYARGGVPASLLRLAIDKCDYEPPFKLTKATPVRAVLTLHDNDGQIQYTQTLEDAASLKELVKILRSMKTDMEGKCGYYGALVLTYKDGTRRTFHKGMDGCGSIMMGSGASRRLSQKADKAFWTLFAELKDASAWNIVD